MGVDCRILISRCLLAVSKYVGSNLANISEVTRLKSLKYNQLIKYSKEIKFN